MNRETSGKCHSQRDFNAQPIIHNSHIVPCDALSHELGPAKDANNCNGIFFIKRYEPD